MLAKVNTCAIVGLEGAVVEVEVDISQGLPTFTMVATQTPKLLATGQTSSQSAPEEQTLSTLRGYQA